MTELWSGEQHRWLEALGHHVYVQGALPGEPVQAARQGSGAALGRPALRPTAPRGKGAPAPASVRRAPPGATATLAPDRLHIALIRASGCNPNTPEAGQVIAGWPSAASLRGDPAAKRALWPRLRALRRSATP